MPTPVYDPNPLVEVSDRVNSNTSGALDGPIRCLNDGAEQWANLARCLKRLKADATRYVKRHQRFEDGNDPRLDLELPTKGS